jgi:DNA-binding response OmpR family regulator
VKVLVVDDEVDHLQYLAATISSWNYDVCQAADGEDAFEILSSSVVDVIVADLMMPRRDGFKLFAQANDVGSFTPLSLPRTPSSFRKVVYE